AIARADGSLRLLLVKLSRIDLLVIDDWAMAPLSEPERRDFWEICEDRYQVHSTIPTSQLRSRAGTNRSAIPLWPMASSTGLFTMPTASRSVAISCGRAVGNLQRDQENVLTKHRLPWLILTFEI